MTKRELPVATFGAIMEAADVKREWVQVEAWGVRVHVRGLSRAEFLEIRNAGMTPGEAEAYAMHKALIEPAVTLEEATTIVAERSYDSIEEILGKVYVLSGLGATFRS